MTIRRDSQRLISSSQNYYSVVSLQQHTTRPCLSRKSDLSACFRGLPTTARPPFYDNPLFQREISDPFVFNPPPVLFADPSQKVRVITKYIFA